MLDFDEETARRLVAVYTTPDVVDQRRAIRAALALQPGEQVLDIGSGPGFLAAEMAEEVGVDGRVYGIDPSDSMLAIARHGETPVDYGRGDALALPFGDEQFDVALLRSMSMWTTSMERWPRRGACCTRAAGCSCWTPTRTRSFGTHPTVIGWSACSRPGTSTSPIRTCRGGCRR